MAIAMANTPVPATNSTTFDTDGEFDRSPLVAAVEFRPDGSYCVRLREGRRAIDIAMVRTPDVSIPADISSIWEPLATAMEYSKIRQTVEVKLAAGDVMRIAVAPLSTQQFRYPQTSGAVTPQHPGHVAFCLCEGAAEKSLNLAIDNCISALQTIIAELRRRRTE